MESIMQAINTVGFPIVMCGALMWYMTKQDERNHAENLSMKEAIQKLELAITKLCEKLNGKESD